MFRINNNIIIYNVSGLHIVYDNNLLSPILVLIYILSFLDVSNSYICNDNMLVFLDNLLE